MYCKYYQIYALKGIKVVLIVAKCIVNYKHLSPFIFSCHVLIVAKCIVNKFKKEYNNILNESINSSKVYCKFINSKPYLFLNILY